jgi:hypothetical protein
VKKTKASWRVVATGETLLSLESLRSDVVVVLRTEKTFLALLRQEVVRKGWQE